MNSDYLWNSGSNDCQNIDFSSIKQHIEQLHQLAKSYEDRGKFVVSVFGEDPTTGIGLVPINKHFEIGQIDSMVDFIASAATKKHQNVYVPLVVMRADLPKNRKGGKDDVVAVLGVIADFDDDEAHLYEQRLPQQAQFVLETSEGRFQAGFLFKSPMEPEKATELARGLHAFAKCDHGTKDISHVWRVPGTLNWPNAKKVAEGRPSEPQLVRLVDQSDTYISDSDFRKLHSIESANPRKSKNSNVVPMLTDDVAAIVKRQNIEIRDLIAFGDSSGDRSKAIFKVVSALSKDGATADQIVQIIGSHPNGIGEKYASRSDLVVEVERIIGKLRVRANSPEVLTEDEICQEFAANHRLDFRFVDEWGKWVVWNGANWKIDKTRKCVQAVKHLVRHYSEGARSSGEQKRLGSRRLVESTLWLAQSEPALTATSAQFDADPYLLNTPRGIVDLKAGIVDACDPLRYMSKCTSVGMGESCPIWLKFLDRVSGGNQEMIDYLQRIAGYCATADIQEHALFFVYGSGGNGKSVFLNTLKEVLADYALQSTTDLVTMKTNESHPTEIARLRGARLVIAQETEIGKRWAEAKIKQLTGGDAQVGRFMRQDFFEFEPQFKLIISGNHKPSFRSVDEGTRRRLHFIPFEITIPAHERDPELPEKLKSEYSGILGWIVEGAQKWFEQGLNKPRAIESATETYFKSQDVVGQWIEDCCRQGPAEEFSQQDAYDSYKSYAECAGEIPLRRKDFKAELEKKGFEFRKKEKCMVVLGLSVISPSVPRY